MAIVPLCESPQQFRALMMILQYHKTLSLISMVLSQCPILCASETSQSCLLCFFWQSLYFPFQFTEFLNLLVYIYMCVCPTQYRMRRICKTGSLQVQMSPILPLCFSLFYAHLRFPPTCDTTSSTDHQPFNVVKVC